MDIALIREEFRNNGFVKINPPDLIDENVLDILNNETSNLILNYADGEVDPKLNDSRQDTRFSYANKIGNVFFNGCALSHRYRLGKGSAKKINDNNFLYGKRAILPERDFSQNLVNFVESEKILKFVADLFNTNIENLSFHNGSLSRVYPGCTGESKKIHIDTPGFIGNTIKLNEDKHLINIFCFLTDISDELAPMRLIPKSHLEYNKINYSLAKSFKRNPNLNSVTQSGHIYDELIEGLDLEKPINLIGKKGTVIAMNSTMLHAATENTSTSKSRDVIIMNFSKKSDKEFRKLYFNQFPTDSKKLIKKSKNKKLFERSFKNNMRNNLYEINLKAVIKKNYNILLNIKSFTKNKIRPLYENISKKFHKKTSDKKYLNIGAGNGWRHKEFISLDLADDIEIKFDLNKEGNLPFKENYLKGIYSSHCLEHLKTSEVKFWLKEFYRVLNKNGVVRLITPDILLYLDAYENKDAAFFDWIRSSGSYIYDSWLRSIIRQFASPVVDMYSDDEIYELYKNLSRENFLNFFDDKIEKINDKDYLWPQVHKSWWSHSKFEAALKEAGFANIEIMTKDKSNDTMFFGKNFNRTRPHMSLFIEAKK